VLTASTLSCTPTEKINSELIAVLSRRRWARKRRAEASSEIASPKGRTSANWPESPAATHSTPASNTKGGMRSCRPRRKAAAQNMAKVSAIKSERPESETTEGTHSGCTTNISEAAVAAAQACSPPIHGSATRRAKVHMAIAAAPSHSRFSRR
jgi:hypothetical protein